ncbi:MAG: glucuronate isomerase [Chloroflexi bacterium]|nr:glucuronate isomerase [Chloroflexota bacterium]MCI0576158.1 glucuronate isomerase [Chloroflexota bacterium]MCI0645427.1 glucuronate isomerase [Chloroflexota bacterium]MCI0731293.1 glucuronate isomerase [Chloroflexota bacterium]
MEEVIIGKASLAPDRYFSPDAAQKAVALELYQSVAGLPLVCPHGHVDPRLFADPEYTFGSPTELFLIPDHYIFRMLYSQGVPLEALGIPRQDSRATETDHRQAWQLFAKHFHLFRGTPTGIWLREELAQLFGVTEKLDGGNAQAIYDQIAAGLQSPEFKPRRLYERFNVEVLCTTDAATDRLAHHQAIRDSGWPGRILPTFRPDAVVNLDTEGWRDHVLALGEVSGIEVTDYRSFIHALEQRRAFFKDMGAKATDHAARSAYTSELSPSEAARLFQRALKGQAGDEDAFRFTGHMLLEMARMSVEDGLVMQLHVGAYRNHNEAIFHRFGRDMGADIPVQAEFTHNLRPLLNKYGNDTRLALILFNLDETTYGRELAPLAGHYPAVKLGPPWWFFDSLNGIRRFFDEVMETAGLYNTAGFNDDTRAFPSIPARHDLWRRAGADWLAGLVVRGVVDMAGGREMARALAYDLAKAAYRL